MLPREVLIEARSALLDWEGTGMSVLELPFTSPEFRALEDHARGDLRALLSLPDDYNVLFLQGGAYAHFALVPMNLMGRTGTADYVRTGHWSNRAINEAARYGRVNVAASGEREGYTRIPAPESWSLDPGAAYCHITTNETAEGLQFHWIPDTGKVPLVADLTSDFLARDLHISRFALVYASAQKNVAPAGLTIVIIRNDLLDRAMTITPTVFNYGLQARNGSRINTPPTWSIYIAGLVFAWLRKNGGLAAVEAANREKSATLYAAIAREKFYSCPVAEPDRSLVNVRFHLADRALESRFLREARERRLVNLDGHSVTGGIRASLYNAMPLAGVEALVEFMGDFARRHSRSIRFGRRGG